MDALSDVLQAIRLDGAVYVNAEFTAPWCVHAKFGLRSASERLPRSDHIVFFHVLVDGACEARLADGDEVVHLRPGDVLLFPHDHLHLLGSDVGLEPKEGGFMPSTDEGLAQIRHGGGGDATHCVCGYLAFDPPICRPLIGALPQMLKIAIADDAKGAWLLELLRVGVRESSAQGPGARTLLAKLAELMFIEAMRRYAESLPAEQRGWLAGLRDRYVGKALGLLHGDPARPWTVDALAREVALSRSALADRFANLIGEPPMQYLIRWRLALAAQRLRAGAESIARIAEYCGYESEAAFNRAFKREFGVPPAAWRKARAPGAGGATARAQSSAPADGTPT
jgi:AraC family transcriptional regulator, alkane utilization regulator